MILKSHWDRNGRMGPNWTEPGQIPLPVPPVAPRGERGARKEK